jgi:cytochrome b
MVMTTLATANRTRVWDPLLRILHWSLAAAFAIAYLSGEEESLIHVYSGYCIATLVVVRIVWGLIGPKHARFASFVRSPTAALGYLRGLVSGTAERHVGHNPAGGWMVLLLLASLAVTCVSGLKVYGLEGDGPWAVDRSAERAAPEATRARLKRDRHRREAWWEEIRELAANLSLVLVIAHVGGVLASSLRHRENLPWAMVTGKKRASGAEN